MRKEMRNIAAAYKNWRHWHFPESYELGSDGSIRGFSNFALHLDILEALLDNLSYGTELPEYANVSYPGDDITEIGVEEELLIDH